MRTSPLVRTAATTAFALTLSLTGCGGGGGDEKGSAPDKGGAGETGLAPLPKVEPAQVKPLTGKWVGAAEDYFLFKTDGTGVWKKDRRSLWNGQAIPEGNGRFRFSWQGGDPKTASYWGVTLTDGGTKLLFAGTNQTYTKAKA